MRFIRETEIFRSEVVWTHTELQFLAVATLLMMRRNGPRLIGQSVWLFDSWPHLWPIRRALYRFLISRVDVLTTHSNANAEIARSLFADKRIEMVHFGLTCDDLGAPGLQERGRLRRLWRSGTIVTVTGKR